MTNLADNVLLKIIPSSIRLKIDQNPNIRAILSNTAWLFYDKAVLIVAGLLVGAWVARYLGPEQYGTLNYALAFVALATPFMQLGLKDIVIRNIIREPDKKNEILGTAIGLQLVASVLVVIASTYIAALMNADEFLTRTLLSIIFLRMIFQPVSNTFEYWFRSQVQAKYFVWSRNITLIFVATIKVILILSEAPLIAFAWAFVIDAAILSIILAIFYHLQGGVILDLRFHLRQASWLLKDSWPLMFSAFAVMIYMKIDQIMVGQMAGNAELGYYSVAVRLSELWYFIPVAIASSVFPAIIQARKSSNVQRYQRQIQFFFDVMAGTSYLIIIPLLLLAKPLVNTLFGPAYITSGAILVVHAWAFIFVSIGVARNRWLIVENMVYFSMITTILGAIVNIAMNYILIPQYSGLGAAWATVISYGVSVYLSSLLLPKLWLNFRQLTLALLMPFRILSVAREFRGLFLK